MESKGDQLVAEAEKDLKKFSFFSSGSEKYDKAHDKFMQAATQYKAAASFSKAAGAYSRAAEMSAKSGNEMDRAVELEESAKAHIKANDTASAISQYSEAVDIYDKNQKFSNAAKACAAAGDIAQGPEAMKWLDRAVKYYRTQGAKVTASEIVQKMADAKARSGDFAGARDIYEQLAREALDDRVARGNARKLFFFALLAQLAMMTPDSMMEDVGALQETFEEYQELDTQFNQHTREHMFISAVIAAIQEEDVEAFDDAATEYDSICPLDAITQKMVAKGKQALRSRLSNLQ